MTPVETSILASHLPPEEQELYNAAIPQELQILYEDGLKRVKRWQNPKFDQYNPNFTETDLEHVEGCLSLFNALTTLFPTFKDGINQSDVRFMLVGHDGPEMYTGDFSLNSNSRDTPRAKRKKRQEPLVMDQYLLPMVNYTYRDQATSLMHRWFRDDPQDVEVQMGHLIDKLHGSMVGAKEVFPYTGQPEQARLEHIDATLSGIHKRAYNLFLYASPTMHEDLNQLMNRTCDLFASIGFLSQAENAREVWNLATTSNVVLL